MTKQLVFLSIATVIALSGCGKNASQQPPSSQQPAGSMNLSNSGKVPKGIKVAQNPTYKVGSQAIIKADHIPGMKGAKATIVGAYDAKACAVSYTPTTGGQQVKNHKWVINEEIKDAGSIEPITPGTQVTLKADHMPGMKGATAKIKSSQHTTVYMVDYTPTSGGQPVKNHKWLTERELSSK